MPVDHFKKKVLKVSAFILGTIAVLLTAFHIWFVNHAEQILEDMVASRSNGKLKLHVKKFRFNYFSDRMQLRNAVFYSTDTATASTEYVFNVARINIRVKEIWPLIFEKKILIDSLGLDNSDIHVTRLRTKGTDTSVERSVSLALEMGRVYKSIQDALEVLQVNRFQIDNGRFTLINKIRPDALPVTITNIYFHLDNLQVDTNNAAGRRKILFSDNVALHTTNQDIAFPDGRHHISFSNFRINVLNKLVEFDSCTVTATRGDSTNSSFKIFFDKLLLTNIDFDTLYHKEVIKADSVYCINPQFQLDVELGEKTGQRKPPRLDELIQLLTGDMQLGYLAVKNGSFDINTMRQGRPSSFTSDHNNFEMRGLRIVKNAPRHLTVKSFVMAIRNSENFWRDSAYSMQFDSILFVNNSVFLSNFSVRQLRGDSTINSFTMPQFELRGLSWDDLVFEGKLSAYNATLHRPVINYTFSTKSSLKNRKQNIFRALAQIGETVDLEYVDLDNGQITVNFRDGQLQLEDATVALSNERLVQSTRVSDLPRTLKHLQFKKGSLKWKDFSMNIEDGDFIGDNGRLTAGKLSIVTKENRLQIEAKNVGIDEMISDDERPTEIHGIRWQEAEIQMSDLPGDKEFVPPVLLTNIQGADTKLAYSTASQKLKVFFETISADELLPIKENRRPQIKNLRTTGKDLSLNQNNLQLNIDRFRIADHESSSFQNLIFKNITATDTVLLSVPAFTFRPDVNSIINRKLKMNDVSINQPIVFFKSAEIKNETRGTKQFPEVEIDKILIQQPEVNLKKPKEKIFSAIDWKGAGSTNNFLQLTGFKISDQSIISANKIGFLLSDFSFTMNGKTLNVPKGEIKTVINDFYLDPSAPDELSWRATIADLYAKGFSFDSIGKNRGHLDIRSARLNGLVLNSASFANPRQVVKENKAFEIKEITGQYTDDNISYSWSNANYDRTTKKFSVDSFAFHPIPTKEEFMASHKYQADYVTMQTGQVSVTDFDPDRYRADTLLDIGMLIVEDPSISVFRDKRLPFRHGLIKPLPTTLLKSLPIRFSVDTILLNNANIDYTELNESTGKAATIPVNGMLLKAFPVHNYNRRIGDSLSIIASGTLLDSIKVKLNMKESYTDSAAGFLLVATLSPADARFLNPVLLPLASLRIESGYWDSLKLHAIATDYLAIGEMKMPYHDLKVELLNPEKEKAKKFTSFLANLFVIKNKRSRPGIIFLERPRDRSSINYLVKILLNGVSSSIGIKNNEKLLRKYKKEQRKRNLHRNDHD